MLVVVLLASCANAPQGDNTPQYEKQVVELPGVSNARQLGGYIIGDKFFEKTLDAIDARYGSFDNFLEQELELSADEKRILRDKFLENR